MRHFCRISWSGHDGELSTTLPQVSHKVGSVDSIPHVVLTNSGPVLLRPGPRFDEQSLYVTPCLCPRACLSRDPASGENQPLLLPRPAHTAGQEPGLCRILVDVPNPRQTQLRNGTTALSVAFLNSDPLTGRRGPGSSCQT